METEGRLGNKAIKERLVQGRHDDWESSFKLPFRGQNAVFRTPNVNCFEVTEWKRGNFKRGSDERTQPRKICSMCKKSADILLVVFENT